jgi:hypothetical protein
MSIRPVVRRVAVTTAALAAAGTFAFAFGFASPAGATSGGATVTPQSGEGALPGPFDSGQLVNVNVPVGADCYASSSPCFTTGSGNADSSVQIVECSTPNGVYPTSNIQNFCDDYTQQGPSVDPDLNGDGGLTYDGYTILALPDVPGGENTSPITCGSTAATECSLYIGDNYQNDGAAHVWSQPFLVNTDQTDSGTVDPGTGTPEVPYAVILPASALGLLGATVVVRRRRAAKAA